MLCAICEARRPRRHCPGVRGEICTVCCGTQREVSVDCPLDCVYLQEAHRHERIEPPAPQTIPNPDVKVTETFLQDHERLVTHLAQILAARARETPGVIDHDIREALGALVRTYRSLESGVLYETRPANPLAAGIAESMRRTADDYGRLERENTGLTQTRDADIMRALVFLERLEYGRNNGRPKGRAFLDFLCSEFGAAAPAGEPPSPLILS